MRHFLRPLWIYIALIGLIITVYGQVAHFDFTNYDDPEYVVENPHIALTLENLAWAVTSGYAGNWFPLTWMSHMLDFRLFGMNSGLHHLTSVLFHALSSILLFEVLRRMTGAFWRAALVAGVFALHPLRVESVARVAERKDVLSTFFWMLTLCCYTRYAEQPSVLRYLPVVASFMLDLMAKPMLVTLPFTLLLLDIWPLHRVDRRHLWMLIREKLPMIALSIAVCVINYVMQHDAGSVISIDMVPVSLRLENALVSYAIYLWMLIWPTRLVPLYPLPMTIPVWQPLLGGMIVGLISLFAFLKGRVYPYLTVGWLWYLGTLVPA